MADAAPTAQPPLSDKQRRRLLQTATTHSESFSRKLMHAVAALDARDDGSNEGRGPNESVGLEFVDSLNGIDLYDQVEGESDHKASTRLCSLCHVDGDIQEVVRRLSMPVDASHRPGVVETIELVNLLDAIPCSSTDWGTAHAGVNWFTLSRESTRDSGTHGRRTTTSSSDPAGSGSGSGSRSRSTSRSRPESDQWGDLSFEFLLLAYQNVFKHRERRGWAQWCQSIDLPNYRPREGSKRGRLFPSGILAVESATRPGHVTLCYVMGLDLRDCASHERKLLESVVWKRVMRLAAFKKSLVRDSLARTMSARTQDVVLDTTAPTSNQHEAVVVPQVHTTKPDQRATHATVAVAAVAVAAPAETARKTVVHPRLRAQTLEPSSLSNQPSRHHGSLFREPTSVLEFRLTYYHEPEEHLDREAAFDGVGGHDLDLDARRGSRIDANHG